LRVTDVRTILVTAPWQGDPFWVPDREELRPDFVERHPFRPGFVEYA
jgi:hypothetical protein